MESSFVTLCNKHDTVPVMTCDSVVMEDSSTVDPTQGKSNKKKIANRHRLAMITQMMNALKSLKSSWLNTP